MIDIVAQGYASLVYLKKEHTSFWSVILDVLQCLPTRGRAETNTQQE